MKKKYTYDELVTKPERLKLNHDELSSSCNMKKIMVSDGGGGNRTHPNIC
jgi:hypothetical protein